MGKSFLSFCYSRFISFSLSSWLLRFAQTSLLNKTIYAVNSKLNFIYCLNLGKVRFVNLKNQLVSPFLFCRSQISFVNLETVSVPGQRFKKMVFNEKNQNKSNHISKITHSAHKLVLSQIKILKTKLVSVMADLGTWGAWSRTTYHSFSGRLRLAHPVQQTTLRRFAVMASFILDTIRRRRSRTPSLNGPNRWFV